MNPKTVKSLLTIGLGVLLLWAAPVATQAQFEYTVNADNSVTITHYTGPPWAVNIPTNINGLTVTSIGENAFSESLNLTSVTIPNSVTSIGGNAFYYCISLTNIVIPSSVTSIGDYAFYSCESLTKITVSGSIGGWAFNDCTSLASITILSNVTSIGEFGFSDCTSLASVTIPGSVASIQDSAFTDCTNLASVFFTGSAPTADSTVFAGDNSNPVIYYLPGTTGWSSPFASREALLWNPLIQTSGTNFGVQSNQFGFNITGTSYIPIVVEVCTNLASHVWIPLQALTVTSGSVYFSEALQTNGFGRYYRISSP